MRRSLQLSVPPPPAYLSPGGLVPIRLPASADAGRGGELLPCAPPGGDECATVASVVGADVATSPRGNTPTSPLPPRQPSRSVQGVQHGVMHGVVQHGVTVDSLSGDDRQSSSSSGGEERAPASAYDAGGSYCDDSCALDLENDLLHLAGYTAAYSPPPPPAASTLLALSSPNAATPPPPPWELPSAYKGAPSPSSVSASPRGRPPPSPAAVTLPKKKKNKAAQLKRLMRSVEQTTVLEPALDA